MDREMINSEDRIELLRAVGRNLTEAVSGDDQLGPLQLLPGTWKNTNELHGKGWNMIAVPFSSKQLNYRLLLNQYNETLDFTLVDKGVPNRGQVEDQLLAVLNYTQEIRQISAEDFPQSGLAGKPNLTIHHETGLWMNMINQKTHDINIARLASIPHGDSILALGKSSVFDKMPEIDDFDSLPIGVDKSLENPYLSPYKHFNEHPFLGLFDPLKPSELLNNTNEEVEIKRVTELSVDTKLETGGITNIPFISKQANATEMVSKFWLQELHEKDKNGNSKLRLQYMQIVFLDFFRRSPALVSNSGSDLIRWPHISINTLEKVD